MTKTINKLLNAYGSNERLHYDKEAANKAYRGVGSAASKKWLGNILPSEILSLTIKQALNIIMTLSESNEFYRKFPEQIETPNYGDLWGRVANYIEINNRAIAQMNYNKTCCGIIEAIKLLCAIPPSARSWANCIILSQIFPNIYGDGVNKPPWEENSLYGIKLNCGYSGNIIDYSKIQYISPEEQLQAFNDIAHFRGIKTGFRIIISEDQIKISKGYEDDHWFRWGNNEHVELFINECVKLINLGFEAIFIDSAKHIGGYDCQHYTGVGKLPYYHQMQYILDEIRKRSEKTHLSFIGEKSSSDFERYKNMGLNGGTAFIESDDINNVKYWSDMLKYSRVYAPGVEVSNDNDEGGRSYEDRLKRIHSVLFGFTYASDKLPSFMQMEDLFPLRYDTNTHHLMMSNPSYSLDGTPKSHYENLFTKEDGRHYNHKVGELFAYALSL